jgi:hypothetical protein
MKPDGIQDSGFFPNTSSFLEFMFPIFRLFFFWKLQLSMLVGGIMFWIAFMCCCVSSSLELHPKVSSFHCVSGLSCVFTRMWGGSRHWVSAAYMCLLEWANKVPSDPGSRYCLGVFLWDHCTSWGVSHSSALLGWRKQVPLIFIVFVIKYSWNIYTKRGKIAMNRRDRTAKLLS